MSDGNFNRNLLPTTLFQSGYRTGVGKTKTIAIAQFKIILHQMMPNLSEKEIAQWSETFHKALNQELKF